MVQVDVFWTYAIGSGFALATAPTIEVSQHARRDLWLPLRRPDRAFVATLLYLGVLFSPSGAWLLWRFPGWETMYALPHPPAWLAAVFSGSNVLCGAVGYVLTLALLARGARWAGLLQCLWPHTLMFFILLHGWDGTGMRRFLTATPAQWAAGMNPALPHLALHWAQSPVALTLGGMGVVLIPTQCAMLARQRTHALRTRALVPGPREDGVRFVRDLAALVFGPCLLAAVCLHLLIGCFGWLPGAAIFSAALPLLRREGPLAGRAVTRLLLPVSAQSGSLPARRKEFAPCDVERY
ncbi:hypothetical protein ACWD1Z_37010 [Streptomyces sp. NPDC002784]